MNKCIYLKPCFIRQFSLVLSWVWKSHMSNVPELFNKDYLDEFYTYALIGPNSRGVKWLS